MGLIMGPNSGPDIGVRSEDCSEKTVGLEFGFRAALFADLVADSPDSGSRLSRVFQGPHKKDPLSPLKDLRTDHFQCDSKQVN